MKKIVSVLLVFFVLLSVSTGMVFADEATEQNIPSEWAMDSIMNSYESGLLDADKEYSYKTPISREDFCELIYSFILKTDFLTKESVKIEEKSFVDTSNEKVLDLAGLGIINGKSQNLFAPLDNLTREEAATIIIRTVNTVSPMPTTEMWFEYEDIKSISGWALNSVQTISNMGIMKGVGNNRFQPKGRYTTEQAITVIWRLYEIYLDANTLKYEDTTIELLSELGIVSADELNKETELTVLDGLKAVYMAMGGMIGENGDLSQWYIGDTLETMDYLDDDTKLLLLGLKDKYVLDYSEIPLIDLNGTMQWHQALHLMLRMTADTYGCTRGISDKNIEKEVIYEKALEKGLISEIKEGIITRKEFYKILHRTLFVEFSEGSVGGVYEIRLIDRLIKNEPTEEPEKTEKERITIPVSAKINDDLSVEWDLPDEYDFLRGNDYLSSVYFVSKDGEERLFFGSTQCVTEIPGEKIAECLVKDLDTKWKTIHYRRYSNEKEYIIEINLPDIKTVIEGEAVTPGKYINKKKSWVLVELTLGGEEKFEPGCYYLLKSYETLYREEEYNKKDYKCFSVDEVSDVFYAPTNQSFGALFPDNVHIQKVTVSGNAKAGFVLSLTPESESIFERVEKSGS